MRKINWYYLIFFLLVHRASLFSQDTSSAGRTSPVDESWMPAVYAKRNVRERAVEFYENGVVKYKMAFNYDSLIRWSIDIKSHKVFFPNGRLRSSGRFVVLTTNGSDWVSPVGRHIRYRRNGRKKATFTYSESGSPVCDTMLKKHGRVRKIKKY